MLSIDEYLRRVVGLAELMPAQTVPVASGFGQILAEDVVAKYPVPPFDNSAMDGFAIAAQQEVSEPQVYRVVGDIPAGAMDLPTVGEGETARIMTGAPMPVGADSVVPVEQTDQPVGQAPLPAEVAVNQGVKKGRHVRYRGEDVAVGHTILKAGARWTPAAASAAASVGYGQVHLRRKLGIAIISTGSELKEPGAGLELGEIPDSNAVLLKGLVEQFGAAVHSLQRASDEPGAFEECLQQAASADLIVTTGGVSVGAYEVVRQVTGSQITFSKVAMQPGKPQGSGYLQVADRRVPLLAFPGNPVSVFVSSWVYMREFIAASYGEEYRWDYREAVAGKDWNCPPGRQQYLPAVLENGVVVPAHMLGSGSHLVASLPLANSLVCVPADVERVVAGDLVRVYSIA